MSISRFADFQISISKIARTMRQSVVKKDQNASCFVVEWQVLHAIQTKSCVQEEWACMRSSVLLSLEYLIDWYWRVWMKRELLKASRHWIQWFLSITFSSELLYVQTHSANMTNMCTYVFSSSFYAAYVTNSWKCYFLRRMRIIV